MTSANARPTILDLDDLVKAASAKTNEVIQQKAYLLLSNCPIVDVDKVEWDTNQQLHGVDGPADVTEIAGCKVDARITIRWPRKLADEAILKTAAEAVADLEFGLGWLREILEHERPPRCATGAEDIATMKWEVTRNGKPEYNAHDGLLTLPVRLEGMK